MSHPEMVGGEGRDVTTLMRRIPSLLAKDGADGVFAGALSDGRAFAIKIADGADRARVPVVLRVLAHLGIDTTVFGRDLDVPILGRGIPVGRVRSLV